MAKIKTGKPQACRLDSKICLWVAMLDTVGKFVHLIIIISSKVKKNRKERGEIRGMELMMLIIETDHFIFWKFFKPKNLGLVINKNRRSKMTPQRDSKMQISQTLLLMSQSNKACNLSIM